MCLSSHYTYNQKERKHRAKLAQDLDVHHFVLHRHAGRSTCLHNEPEFFVNIPFNPDFFFFPKSGELADWSPFSTSFSLSFFAAFCNRNSQRQIHTRNINKCRKETGGCSCRVSPPLGSFGTWATRHCGAAIR